MYLLRPCSGDLTVVGHRMGVASQTWTATATIAKN